MNTPVPCQACGSTGRHDVAQQFEHAGSDYTVRRCGNCQSLFYDPVPVIDYTTHTLAPESIRDYVEHSANIHALVELGIGSVGDRRNGRLLDMGCGFGFAADAMRRLRGWDVTGVEPSHYGRVGGESLGIRVIPDFVDERHPLARERFDVILASEVVEHIENPTKFLAFLRSMLAEGGILTLTVPEAGGATAAENPATRLAVLSPGAHVTLFTKRGMEIALRNAGFSAIEVEKRHVSLVCRASNRSLPPRSEADVMALHVSYLRKVLDDPRTSTSLRHGMASRLLRSYVALGRYAEAEAVVPMTAPSARDSRRPLESYQDFIGQVSPALPADLFSHGILALNHHRNVVRAAELFRDCYALSRTKIQVNPGGSAVEVNMYWAVVLHWAFALMAAGDFDEALWVVARFEHAVPAGFPQPRESERVRAREIIDQINGFLEQRAAA